MPEVDTAMDEFFQMKGAYEKQLRRKRRRIIDNPSMDTGEKMRALSAVRGKCINCNGSDGMVFTQKGTMLSVTCGGSCPLDIRVDRGKFVLLRSLIQETNAIIREIETEILALKLDMVFGFEGEEATSQRYGPLKAKYDRVAAKIKKLLDTYELLTTEKDRFARVAKLSESIETARVALRTVERGDYSDKPMRMVRIFVDEIMPAAKELRNVRYATSGVECPSNDCSAGTHELVQRMSTYQDRMVMVRKQKLYSYVK